MGCGTGKPPARAMFKEKNKRTVRRQMEVRWVGKRSVGVLQRTLAGWVGRRGGVADAALGEQKGVR